VTLFNSLWQSQEFKEKHNPNITLPFISFKNGTNDPAPCTSDILAMQFPEITKFFPNKTCEMILWFDDIKNFTINTGRFFTQSKQ